MQKKRTRWPLMVLLFVVPGAGLTYWSPDLISSAAPPAEAVAPPAAVAATAQQDGWQPLSARGDATKVTTISIKESQPIADEPAAETQVSTPAPAASSQVRADCRKYLRTLHLPKAAPKAKAVGLLEQPDKTAKAADPNKAVAILNQRILKADECLKRAGPGS